MSEVQQVISSSSANEEMIHSVPYAALAEVFERIDSTTKRLEIAEYLTTFLTNVITRTPGDLVKVIYLCINRVRMSFYNFHLADY